MAKYVCTICGYIYDEAIGIPEDGIESGTAWKDLPKDWVCTLCGAEKSEFEKQGEPVATTKKPITKVEVPTDMKEMSPLELSALCSNLARGCEKQYKQEQAALYMELAEYYKKVAVPADSPSFDKLLDLIENDLSSHLPNASTVASNDKDRGALRALVWNEKVTRILKSLVSRYQKEGEAMLSTGVYVCTICGFIYIGDNLPKVCPVCKVPNWKFDKV